MVILKSIILTEQDCLPIINGMVRFLGPFRHISVHTFLEICGYTAFESNLCLNTVLTLYADLKAVLLKYIN